MVKKMSTDFKAVPIFQLTQTNYTTKIRSAK